MVRVEKNWEFEFLSQAFQESGKLARTKELSLSFGRANEYRNLDFIGGPENRLQQNQVSDIEVAEGCAFFFQSCQNIS
jgi:hypothetical protein